MIYGVGVDICDSRRISKLLEVHGERFELRICCAPEIAYLGQVKNKALALTKFFAAKEAVSKAMRTGIRGFEFRDIEIKRDKLGAPSAILHSNALTKMHFILGEQSDFRFHLSLSDEGEFVVAYAVLETHDR